MIAGNWRLPFVSCLKGLRVACWLAGVVKLHLVEGGNLYLFGLLVLLCICRLSPVARLHVRLFSIVDFDVFP